ncbi:MAG: ABC transporter ATP-binding protein [Nitrososphaeria archaeon]
MIKLNDVYYTYGTGYAVEGVSFEIKEGEATALVGPNGSGKTTLAKLISGIIKPVRGSVYVDDADTKKCRPSEIIRKVGIIFQNPDYQLFESTVLEEVMFALKNMGYDKKEAQDRAMKALERFGLSKYADRPPLSLSGGEKKRLTFAIVYAWEPKYIIFDEPTVGQDGLNLRNLRNLIDEILKEGKGVIITSHDMEFLWPLNPSTFVVKKGRVVWKGKMKDLFKEANYGDANLTEPQLSVISKKLYLTEPALSVEDAAEVIKGVSSI